MGNRLFRASVVLGVGVALTLGGNAWAKDKRNGRDQDASARISREVRHELIMLPYYGIFDNRPTLKSDA